MPATLAVAATTRRWFAPVFLAVALAACAGDTTTVVVGDGSSPRASYGPVEPPEGPPYAQAIPIYRWHKLADHLFGVDPNEGYPYGYVLDHSPAFYLFDTGPSYHYVELYRCWRQNSLNQHFVTLGSSCDGEPNTVRENLDGIYAVRDGFEHYFPGVVPLYRVSFPGNGDDMVTTDEAERAAVLANGWQDRGVVGWVYPA